MYKNLKNIYVQIFLLRNMKSIFSLDNNQNQDDTLTCLHLKSLNLVRCSEFKLLVHFHSTV